MKGATSLALNPSGFNVKFVCAKHISLVRVFTKRQTSADPRMAFSEARNPCGAWRGNVLVEALVEGKKDL